MKRRRRGALLQVDRSDPSANLQALVSITRERLPSLGVNHDWSQPCWSLSPTLFALTGKHTQSVTLNFCLPPILGSNPLSGAWGDVARVLFIEREREVHKSISAHRTFVSAIGYIKEAARTRTLEQLTPAILDQACVLIDRDSQGGERYKRHNLVSEFARRCSLNGLCRVDLTGYVYYGRSRPSNYGGDTGRKLDDPAVMNERPPRVLAESTFMALGELFAKVPSDHKYRIYLLIITLLVCLGRRLSEVTLLPRQALVKKPSGYYFLYLKLKAARGNQQHELVWMVVMTEVVPLVEAVLRELSECSSEQYACAEEMCRINGPDLRFLADMPEDEPLYFNQLLAMGLPKSVFFTSWFNRQGLIKRNLSLRGGIEKNGYLFKRDVERYCRTHYKERMTQPLYIASGRPYFIKDMLLLKWLGTSSGHYARWIADTITSACFDKFLQQLEALCVEYSSGRLDQKFTSHDFRHTMNDALDKGGLPELMQTEYFGRKNPVDTKAYQHTSPERQALEIREKILLGQVGGEVAERAMRLPVDKREAFVTSRVRAVHDLGNGMCFHSWQLGPCDRHLQCDSGCGLLAWMKQPAEPSEVYEELMRQAAHNLIQLEVGYGIFPSAIDSSPNWEKHLCLKISHLLDRASELVPETGLDDLYHYINTGGFDTYVVPKLIDSVGKGYELYKRCREQFYAQCLEFERDWSPSTARTVQYVPVELKLLEVKEK